jgi:hypothetical protein
MQVMVYPYRPRNFFPNFELKFIYVDQGLVGPAVERKVIPFPVTAYGGTWSVDVLPFDGCV